MTGDTDEDDCKVCTDQYPKDVLVDGVCIFCRRKSQFADFARKCGLQAYPSPSGERYVYRLDGKLLGKKSEEIDFIDELWAALVRTNGASDELIPG